MNSIFENFANKCNHLPLTRDFEKNKTSLKRDYEYATLESRLLLVLFSHHATATIAKPKSIFIAYEVTFRRYESTKNQKRNKRS